jgi:hypothetical protein
MGVVIKSSSGKSRLVTENSMVLRDHLGMAALFVQVAGGSTAFVNNFVTGFKN